MSYHTLPMTPIESAAVSVISTGAGTTLTINQSQSRALRLMNAGTQVVYYSMGKTASAAGSAMAADCHPLLPGAVEVFMQDGTSTSINFLAASGTQTVYVTAGYGQ